MPTTTVERGVPNENVDQVRQNRILLSGEVMSHVLSVSIPFDRRLIKTFQINEEKMLPQQQHDSTLAGQRKTIFPERLMKAMKECMLACC